MAEFKNVSAKQLMVDKANRRVLIAAGAGAFIVIFSLVASWSLFGQMLYQNKVVSAKKDTLKQLESNIQAVDSLKTSYSQFVSASPNLIGGSISGEGANDGDNAKIILDALPSKYDFPALANSLEGLINGTGAHIDSIGGIDDEVAQSATTSSGTPQPIAVPFQISASGSYDSIKGLIDVLERSIRPIKIQTINVSASSEGLSVAITAETYYQPEKKFNVTKEVMQ